MFNSRTRKGEETRRRVQEAALALFREKGFDATTMRDVAAAAELSLGAAYHYFASKEAIVMAYYNAVQDRHDAEVRALVRETPAVRDRLVAAFHGKLRIVADDRKMLGALLRFTGQPEHPLSFLGPATRDIQLRSIATFGVLLHGAAPADEDAALEALALWAMHMGVLLYFVYDDSPGQARTHRLAEGAVDLFVAALRLLRFPLLRPLRRRLAGMLGDAGLLPHPDALAAAAASGAEAGAASAPAA
jgi:AcrR family transcriptional regulator